MDDVLGPIEMAPELIVDPETILPGIGYDAGVATLPDGLLLVHDLEAFLSLDEERRLAGAIEQDTR